MTYKQIEQIENYITEIGNLRYMQIDDSDLFNRAKTLDSRIASSVKEYSPKGISWTSALTPYVGGYDSGLIHRFLGIMEDCLTSILNSIPIYPKICEVRKDVEDGKILDEDEKIFYIIKISEKYSNCINFSKGVQDLVHNNLDEKYIDENTVDTLHVAVLEKLKLHLNDICTMSEKTNRNNRQSQQINVVQNNNQVNNQQMNVNLDISISECCKMLDDCETLSQTEIDDIKKQLDDVQNLLKDKKGKRKTIRQKLSSMLKWVADKGTDAMISLLPTIVAILGNL